MTKNNCPITGSSDMLFINPIKKWTGKQSCMFINMLNEATCAYTREFAKKYKYENRNHSENESFTKDYWLIYETPIEEIMVCVNHQNTIDKSIWEQDNYKAKLPAWFFKGKYFRILSKIFEKEIEEARTKK
jgi:hypothetical protein